MGTNFYWIINPETMQKYDESSEDFDDWDPIIHIGKRSFAGAYCEDCGVLLSLYGTRSAHTNNGLSICPICGKSREEVSGASSFTWTMMKHRRNLEMIAEKYPHFIVCKDEYGTKLTALEMLEEASDCIIQFQDASRFG